MSPTDALSPGMIGTADFYVTKEKTAPVVGSGSVDVFATPMLVAAMEAAACAAIDAHLPETHTSLGVKVDVLHLAPTPVGLTVTATAELVNVDGRKLTFKVTANDGKGAVGNGTHTRVIVDRERFNASVAAKASG